MLSLGTIYLIPLPLAIGALIAFVFGANEVGWVMISLCALINAVIVVMGIHDFIYNTIHNAVREGILDAQHKKEGE